MCDHNLADSLFLGKKGKKTQQSKEVREIALKQKIAGKISAISDSFPEVIQSENTWSDWVAGNWVTPYLHL